VAAAATFDERLPDGAPRRRVLVLIKCLGHGGAEQLVVQMIRHRDPLRFDYEVAYILEDLDALVPEIEASGIVVHCLGAKRNADLSWSVRLRALLLQGRFDLVHTHLPYAATIGRMVVATLPRLHRPAVVYTEHGMWDKMAITLRVANRATIRLDDRLVSVSEAARESMPRTLRRKAVVVVHGIDLDTGRMAALDRPDHRQALRRELGTCDDAIVALTVANLRKEKGIDVLLRAAALVRDRGTPVRFVSVGSGPEDAALQEQHAALGLGDVFRFLGPRSDVISLMAGADMFVLPSRHEGLPVTVMEATSVGMPIIATSVGELPRIFKDGEGGVLVPPEAPEALARAIVEVADNRRLRDRLASATRGPAELFDVDRCVREVEFIYDQLRPPGCGRA
jgi:glycosyltransferase involved in cell wall biosynthesis